MGTAKSKHKREGGGSMKHKMRNIKFANRKKDQEKAKRNKFSTRNQGLFLPSFFPPLLHREKSLEF